VLVVPVNEVKAWFSHLNANVDDVLKDDDLVLITHTPYK
jgi:hypothetical protein